MIGFGVAELKSFFAGFLEDYIVIFERLWGVLKDSGCFSCGFICSELSLQYWLLTPVLFHYRGHLANQVQGGNAVQR